MMNFRMFLVVALFSAFKLSAQPDRWQQQISYQMEVNLDVSTNLLKGRQVIVYKNQSPDTLSVIYFHLYWNAFRPNSSMDVRSRELGTKVVGRNRDGSDRLDWDGRVTDRISKLKPEETGYCKITSISMNGVSLKGQEYETIVKYTLPKPILPRQSVTLQTQFECRVPVQIRRSGRDNAEGVRYSMSQWYPKVVEYDYTGWNANPYIAREFYGVWGDYDVKINLDPSYKIGASGVLQNAGEIGWGYDREGTPLKPATGTSRTWWFKAQKVHDFVWAADPGYQHITRQTAAGGPLLHFIFKSSQPQDPNWVNTANECTRAYPFIKKTFGAYPWPQYSFIQGGDGGMEYAMATLVKNYSLGTAIHEWMHSWYQHLMGTNESLYAWMDEGFTSYAESRVSHWLGGGKGIAQEGDYRGYLALARSKFEEPMSTHADHFATNYAYSSAAYGKGAVFLWQLGYVVGDSVLDQILQRYYQQWKFRHPNPNDFIRVAEKTSGLELDWYKEYWVNTTKTIDYIIDSIWVEDTSTLVRIVRKGEMPMPVDVTITFKDSSAEMHYIPLALMYGEKPRETAVQRTVYPAQPWTHRTMIIKSSRRLTDIIRVEIDASQRLADLDRKNNKLELSW